MAAASSALALDVLAQLDRELADLLKQVEATIGVSAPMALTGLRAAFYRVDDIASAVRERVTTSLANSAFEWSDRIVQTRTLVVLAELAMLCDAAKELPPEARLFGAEFPGVDALFAYVLRGIERITHGLEQERQFAQGVDSLGMRAAFEAVAFGKAACGIAAIGRDERLVRALHVGARMPSLRFAVACRALLISLGSPSNAADLIPELPSIRRPRGGDPS